MTREASHSDGAAEYRGHRWLAGRMARAIPYSFACGAGFGGLTALGMTLHHASNPLNLQGVLFVSIAVAVGSMVGAAASPLMIAVTTGHDVKRGVLTVFACTGLVALLSGVWSGDPAGMQACVLVTLAAYACSCIAWRLWIGSDAYALRPGHCAGCGYSLAGLRAQECPECGAVAASDARAGGRS